MPIYEYECSSCGKTFEVNQRISDNPLKKCEFCQGPVRRLISQTSFTLRGGGWYQDGYSKSAPKKEAKEAKEGTAKVPETKPAKPPATTGS